MEMPMTYPSMTITTTPASDGAGSTSKEGNALPLPVTEGINATPAPDAPSADMVQRIDGTISEVSFHFSTSSRKTMSEKIAAFWYE